MNTKKFYRPIGPACQWQKIPKFTTGDNRNSAIRCDTCNKFVSWKKLQNLLEIEVIKKGTFYMVYEELAKCPHCSANLFNDN